MSHQTFIDSVDLYQKRCAAGLGWVDRMSLVVDTEEPKPQKLDYETDSVEERMSDNDRLSWDDYFIQLAYLVAKRSTCTRRSVGAVAVKDRRILATGYNGAPSGVPHCAEVGCLRSELGIPSGQRHEICRAVHAEQNLIIQSARYGVSLQDAEVYCTTKPCFICAKMLMNCGVRTVYYVAGYPDKLTDEMVGHSQMRLVQIKPS